MDHHTVAEFHANQIEEILSQTGSITNVAWSTSILSAVQAMEHGLLAKSLPKRAAASVLKKAALARQAEHGPSNKWYIASLVESLASLRLLSIKYPELRSGYDAAKREILSRLPK